MIDRKNLSEQPVKNESRKNNNIEKVAAGQGNDYNTTCLLDYTYFRIYYKIIAIDLSKLKALDASQKQYKKSILLEIQKELEELKCCSLLKKQKKPFLIFHKEI